VSIQKLLISDRHSLKREYFRCKYYDTNVNAERFVYGSDQQLKI